MRRLKKTIAFLIVLLAIGLIYKDSVYTVRADPLMEGDNRKFVGIVLGYDEVGNLINCGAAVPCKNGDAYLVITDENIRDDSIVEYDLQTSSGNTMQLEFMDNYSNVGLAIWTLAEGYEADDAFFEAAYSRQNQAGEILYYDAEGYGYYSDITVTDVVDSDIGLNGISVDGFPEETIMYPALIIDENEHCLGVVGKGNFIWTTLWDETYFYVGSSNTSTQTDAGTDTGSNSMVFTTGEKNGNTGGSPIIWIVLGIVAVAVIAAIVVVVIVVVKKKAKKSKAQQTAPQMTPPPIAEAEEYGKTMPLEYTPQPTPLPIITEAEEYGKTMPLEYTQQPTPQQSIKIEEYDPTLPLEHQAALVNLRATDGPLKGEVFPLCGKEMIIGRSNQSFAPFAEGTSGVDRNHCRIFIEEGHLMLEDLGSEQGTYLKTTNSKIEPGTPVCVEIGTEFYLGKPENSFIIQ